MKPTQKQIAAAAGISEAYLSMISARKKLPIWPKAKALAAVTCTDPVLWLDGTTEQIREALASCHEDSAA